jgi:hypothetical protein
MYVYYSAGDAVYDVGRMGQIIRSRTKIITPQYELNLIYR